MPTRIEQAGSPDRAIRSVPTKASTSQHCKFVMGRGGIAVWLRVPSAAEMWKLATSRFARKG